jgi:hypothetical protein
MYATHSWQRFNQSTSAILPEPLLVLLLTTFRNDPAPFSLPTSFLKELVPLDSLFNDILNEPFSVKSIDEIFRDQRLLLLQLAVLGLATTS